MKRYDDALEELNIIVDLKPDDFDARRKIGLIYLEQKRWSEAITVFRDILEIRPDLDPARYYLGTAYEKLSQWDLALEAFLGIDKNSSLYDDALSHIGYIYLENDRLDEAISLLENRLSEGQPRPQVYNYLASLYMADEQKDKAITTVEAGVTLYPDNVELLYQKGLILERSGRHEEAQRAMKNVLAVDAEHAESLNFLAYALALDNRDLDQALEYAQRAIRLNPAPHILDTLGWVYYRQGRYLEALKVIEEASSQLSNDAVVFEHLGEIHLALQNLDEAREAFARALELQPDNLELRNKLESLLPER
jgi:tetratricopeptide (TPR) repeat protein